MTTDAGPARPNPLFLASRIACLSFTALWLVISLSWPFGWDQGIFAWVGSVIVDGGAPYRDAVDLKGPLPYYVYAATQAILGQNTWGIRVVDACIMILAALALRSVVAGFVAGSTGTFAACALVLWMGSLGFWSTAQPDGWVAGLLIGAVALLFAGSRPTRAIRIAGAAALVGLTGLVKPFYLVFGVLPVAWIWLPAAFGGAYDVFRSLRAVPRHRIGLTVVALSATLLPIVLAAGWLALVGALDDAVDVHLRFTAQSYWGIDQLDPANGIRGLIRLATRLPALVFAFPAIAAGLAAAWRTDRPKTVLLATWSILATGCIVLQGRFNIYQSLPAFPPLVVFAALGFDSLLRATRSSPAPSARSATAMRAFVVASLVLVLVQLAVRPARDIRRAARLATGAITREAYYRSFAAMASFNAADEMHIARVLHDRSEPGDHVAIVGYNAGILFLADRRSPSRFGPSVPYTDRADTPLTRRFQREFMDAIVARPPEWVVIGAIHGGAATLETRIRSHPRLAPMLEQRYCVDQQIGHYVLMRRCD